MNKYIYIYTYNVDIFFWFIPRLPKRKQRFKKMTILWFCIVVDLGLLRRQALLMGGRDFRDQCIAHHSRKHEESRQMKNLLNLSWFIARLKLKMQTVLSFITTDGCNSSLFESRMMLRIKSYSCLWGPEVCFAIRSQSKARRNLEHVTGVLLLEDAGGKFEDQIRAWSFGQIPAMLRPPSWAKSRNVEPKQCVMPSPSPVFANCRASQGRSLRLLCNYDVQLRASWN